MSRLALVVPPPMDMEARLRASLVVYRVGWQSARAETGTLVSLTLLYRDGEAQGECTLKRDRSRRWVMADYTVTSRGCGVSLKRVAAVLADAAEDVERLLRSVDEQAEEET